METTCPNQWYHHIFCRLQTTNLIKYWGIASPAKLIQNESLEGWQHDHSYIKCENLKKKILIKQWGGI